MYDSPCPSRWDNIVFGVNNGGMPLHVYMNDIMEIAKIEVQGSCASVFLFLNIVPYNYPQQQKFSSSKIDLPAKR